MIYTTSIFGSVYPMFLSDDTDKRTNTFAFSLFIRFRHFSTYLHICPGFILSLWSTNLRFPNSLLLFRTFYRGSIISGHRPIRVELKPMVIIKDLLMEVVPYRSPTPIGPALFSAEMWVPIQTSEFHSDIPECLWEDPLARTTVALPVPPLCARKARSHESEGAKSRL
jgi:hypothetical protein